MGSGDEVDRRLVEVLQKAGRTSLAALGREVGMSAPSVTERLRRLEDDGVIESYAAIVDPARLGYGLLAFVHLASTASPIPRAAMDALLQRSEILEAHHVVGNDCWIMKVVAEDTAHLEQLLEAFADVGTTSTSIVLSSPVRHRPVPQPGELTRRPRAM